jgi:hypothetical protein
LAITLQNGTAYGTVGADGGWQSPSDPPAIYSAVQSNCDGDPMVTLKINGGYLNNSSPDGSLVVYEGWYWQLSLDGKYLSDGGDGVPWGGDGWPTPGVDGESDIIGSGMGGSIDIYITWVSSP